MSFKIIDGTPKSGKSLCVTCKTSVIVKGQNGEEAIGCSTGIFSNNGSGYGRVPFKVAECTLYHPVNMPWKYEMEAMAWDVQARKRGSAGFGDASTENSEDMIVSIEPPAQAPKTPVVWRQKR